MLGKAAVGVDIGCKTGRMVKAHPQLSQLAFENHFKCLVGSFHGHLCQVSNLAIYVEGGGSGGLRGMQELVFEVKCPHVNDTVLHRVP
jgi:hypothetical protein